MDKISNGDVIEKMKDERLFLHVVKRGKGIWIGHIVRKSGLLSLVLEVIVEEEKRGWKRQKLPYHVQCGILLGVKTHTWNS